MIDPYTDPYKPQEIFEVDARTVVAVSPNRDHFKEFQKRQWVLMWIMPVWKKEELKILQYLIPITIEGDFLTNDEFEDRYRDFGGRIRLVFTDTEKRDFYFDQLTGSA